MLAKAVHLDILDNHQLIVILVEDSTIHDIAKILLVPLGEEHHRLGVSLGRPMQAFSVGIFADAFQYRAHRARELG